MHNCGNISLYWGFSMYGGYYAAIAEDRGGRTVHYSYHTRTLRELREDLARHGLKAYPSCRWDN